MSTTIFQPLKFSFLFISFSLGLWDVFVDVITNSLPLGVITVGLLMLATYVIRVPPPDQEVVNEILGPDPLDCRDAKNKDVVKVIAHRGCGLDAPENTLEAFNYCASKGINFIEFDIHLTKDLVPVVFHDDTMYRLADSTFFVNEECYEDLKEFDLSVKHPYHSKFKGATMPTLDEAVQLMLKNKQHMIFDIKHNDFKVVTAILKIYEKYPELYSCAMVSSFYPNLIYLVRRSNPKIVCSLAWRPHIFANESYSYPEGPGPKRSSNIFKHVFLCFLDVLHAWTFSRIMFYLLGVSAVLLHKDVISSKIVMDWRAKGIRVMAWTVNHPAEKQHFSKVLKVTYLTDTLTGESTAHST